MHSPTLKLLAIVLSIVVVMFLLFASGAMSAPTVSGDMAVTSVLSDHAWIWIVPTLLIFGLGFLLAWVVLGTDTVAQERRIRTPDAEMGGAVQANVCYWERIDDPYQTNRG